jgi:hypothetical protein
LFRTVTDGFARFLYRVPHANQMVKHTIYCFAQLDDFAWNIKGFAKAIQTIFRLAIRDFA